VLVNSPQFVERHIIGPDTEILGGVFLGRGAIVVDFEENPEGYESTYEALDAVLPEASEEPLVIVQTINEVVRKVIPLDRVATRAVLKSEAEARGLPRIGSQDEIRLSKFIGVGGICHHQTLLGGTMLRLLQDRRGIGGTVSVEPGQLYKDVFDRHVWLRYTHGDRRIIIDTGDNHVTQIEGLVSSQDMKYLKQEEKED